MAAFRSSKLARIAVFYRRMIRGFSLLVTVLASLALGRAQVEQVHLSLTGDDASMGLDFVAKSQLAAVQFRRAADPQAPTQTQSSAQFIDGIGWLHNALMQGYVLRCLCASCLCYVGVAV